MIHLHSCPKCLTGALYEHFGLDGLEKKCVNCGFIVCEVSLEMTSSKTSSETPVTVPAA